MRPGPPGNRTRLTLVGSKCSRHFATLVPPYMVHVWTTWPDFGFYQNKCWETYPNQKKMVLPTVQIGGNLHVPTTYSKLLSWVGKICREFEIYDFFKKKMCNRPCSVKNKSEQAWRDGLNMLIVNCKRDRNSKQNTQYSFRFRDFRE